MIDLLKPEKPKFPLWLFIIVALLFGFGLGEVIWQVVLK